MKRRYASYDQLRAEWFEIFSPLHDTEWNLIVDQDGPEYGSAMLEFSDLLAESGWSWNRWFAAEHRHIQIMEAARLAHRMAALK